MRTYHERAERIVFGAGGAACRSGEEDAFRQSSSEERVLPTGAMDHTDNLDATADRSIVVQVAREREASQARSKIVSSDPEPGVVGQETKPPLNSIDEAVGIRGAVARDVIPDFVDVGLSERRDDYLGHAPAR